MSFAALKTAVSKQHHAHRIAYPRTAYGEGHRAQPIQLVSPVSERGHSSKMGNQSAVNTKTKGELKLLACS